MIFTYLFRQVRLYDKGAYIKPSVNNCPQLCLGQLLTLRQYENSHVISSKYVIGTTLAKSIIGNYS